MNFLAASRPCGDDLFGRGGLAVVLDQVPGRLGGSASTIMIATSSPTIRPATTMSKVERSASEKLGKATHWPSMSETRTPPIGPLNGRPEIWVDALARVDGQHVVLVVGVERVDGDDDLDLVAQALDEAGAQRAVDEPAGEDGLGRWGGPRGGRRAGDLARGVHPLLDVDGQREEVELVLGGACRRSSSTGAWSRRRGRR
jgi:hypothetical protein